MKRTASPTYAKRTSLNEARRLATRYAGMVLVTQSIDSDPEWLDDFVVEDDVPARRAFHARLRDIGESLIARAAMKGPQR